jgi:hypothetical protein
MPTLAGADAARAASTESGCFVRRCLEAVPVSVSALVNRPWDGELRETDMQYAILCYHDEKVTCAWSKEHDDAVMAKLAVVRDKLVQARKLGPVARLLPTTAATTLRKDREPPLVIDGPFAETKEQLLGFYIVDCAGLDEAIEIAKELGEANPGGAYEIRPVGTFFAGKTAS